MRLICIIFVGLLILIPLNKAFADSPKLCLSGVCLGATLSEIPGNIKWASIPVMNPNTKFSSPDFDAKLSRTLQAEQSTIRQLDPYRNMLGDLAGINSEVIAGLQNVRGSCSYLTLDGVFYSESGHKTTVTIKAYPNSDGRTQQFRVSQIIREYADLQSDQDRQHLTKQLQEQLKYEFTAANRNSAGVVPSSAPSVGFNSFAPNSFFIKESPKLYFDTTNADIYRRLPGCSHQQKID